MIIGPISGEFTCRLASATLCTIGIFDQSPASQPPA